MKYRALDNNQLCNLSNKDNKHSNSAKINTFQVQQVNKFTTHTINNVGPELCTKHANVLVIHRDGIQLLI